MRPSAKTMREYVVPFLEKYSIVLGALVIYGYYLVLTLDLFSDTAHKGELLGLLLRFDSVLLLWGVVYVVVQLQKYRSARKTTEDQDRNLLRDFQRQQLQLASLDDISNVLNDRINNPLSMISLSAGSLRQMTYKDSELGADVEKIESALKRVQEVMMGIHSYHAKKIIGISRELLDESIGIRNPELDTVLKQGGRQEKSTNQDTQEQQLA